MAELPWIISVDDHVVEPPNVWMDRLPKKYADVGPRIVRAPMGEITFVGGKLTVVPGRRDFPPTGGTTRISSGRCSEWTLPSGFPATRSPCVA